MTELQMQACEIAMGLVKIYDRDDAEVGMEYLQAFSDIMSKMSADEFDEFWKLESSLKAIRTSVGQLSAMAPNGQN